MIKEEKALYKSGRKNKTGYSKVKITKSSLLKLLVILMLFIASILITFFEFIGVTNWHTINNEFGATNGVKPSQSEFAVYYLDVGQSDCSIVVSKDEVMVIDTGSYPRYNHIVETLYALNIEKIDYLVITHPHNDHYSGAERLLDKFKIYNIIMPSVSFEHDVDNETYSRLLNTVAKNNVNPISAQAIDTFKLGGSTVNILAPLKSYKELNNMSIVLKVVFGDTSFLFQGDAEEMVEDDLLEANIDLFADVLKLGHHGSKTSTSIEYLKAVKPSLAVVSCGAENTYGHPRVAVIENLEKCNIDYLVTAISGDIVVESDGKEIKTTSYK